MAGRITLGQQLRYAPDYVVGSAGAGGAYNKVNNLYLPASTAGSPAISPAFDTTFWTDTSTGVRVIGRIGKKFGTSLESDSVAHTLVTATHLSRQFVIPLAGIGLLKKTNGGLNYCSLQATLAVLCSVSNADSTIYPMASLRIVDSGGATKDAAHTQGSVTIPATGSFGMVGPSGAWSSGDVGRLFIVQSHDNLLSSGASVNVITRFTNSSHVTIGTDYHTLSGAKGSGRTIRYVDDNRAFVTIGPGSTSTADVTASFGGDNTSYASQIDETDYLVVEVGYEIYTPAAASRNYRLKYRDTNDTILPASGGASGAVPFFSSLAPVLSLSGL